MAEKKQETTKVDPNQKYTIIDAATLLGKVSTSKFAGTVDVDIIFDLSDKHQKENVAGSIALPHQFGDAKKVIVFAEGNDAKDAEAAGAIAVGVEDLVKKVEDGKVDFDIAISTPLVMPKVAKLGRILGPKGLMPNPSNGTVAADVTKAVKEFSAGKINFKKNEQQAIRTGVAKVDMTPEAIAENITEFIKAVYLQARRLNSSPFKKITVSPTMGAGIKLDISSLMEAIA